MVESVHGALGTSLVVPSTCKSLFWMLSGALTGSPWLCGPSALAEGGLIGSETGSVGLDKARTLGVSLRSTRGPTSGWVLALRELDKSAGLFWGEDLEGATLVELQVRVVLSLAGLLCAVLKLSVIELVAVEGKFTTVEVVSAAAGLFGGKEQDKQGGEGRVGSGGRGGITESPEKWGKERKMTREIKEYRESVDQGINKAE